MPSYRYIGRDVFNRIRRGIVEAENVESAKELLLERGIVVIEKLKEYKPFLSAEVNFSFLNRISLKDIVLFTRQLHALVNAGIPLVQALRIIKDQVSNKRFKQIIDDIATYIEEGGKFYVALSKYRSIFGDLYVSMIKAAEEAGTLEETLKRLAEHLEKVEQLRGKVKSAMFYPIFVLVVATVIVIGILVFVIPTFQQLYADLGGQLPSLTQMVINVSNWLRDYIGWFLLGTVVFFIAIFQLRKFSERFRYLTDLLLLKIPIFGELILKSSIANFSRTLSSMISSGINILDALQISAETANNEVVMRALLKVRQQVERGVSLALAMSRIPIFPPMIVNMAAVGEQAGNLDTMLSKAADFYEEEVDRTVDALTSLIEPLLMVFIGSVIGVIVVAMYLPIFKIGELIK